MSEVATQGDPNNSKTAGLLKASWRRGVVVIVVRRMKDVTVRRGG